MEMSLESYITGALQKGFAELSDKTPSLTASAAGGSD